MQEKKHKEEKHKNREKSEDLVKQAKKFLKAQLSGKGDGMSEQGAPEVDEKMRISEDDYFAKNNEFTTWLQVCPTCSCVHPSKACPFYASWHFPRHSQCWIYDWKMMMRLLGHCILVCFRMA